MARRYEVRFEIEAPDDMPYEDAEEWAAFEVGAACQMTPRHPAMNGELDVVRGSFRLSASFHQPKAS